MANQFKTRVTKDLLCLGVDHLYPAFGIDQDHRIRRGLDHPSKPFFKALAGSNVANCADEDQPLVIGGLDDRQLDRKSAAVLAQA